MTLALDIRAGDLPTFKDQVLKATARKHLAATLEEMPTTGWNRDRQVQLAVRVAEQSQSAARHEVGC